MKSILMSIKPKWVEKIISGEKTIEVRKTAPKEVPFKAYIYCTGVKNLNLTEYIKLHRKTGGEIDYWHGKVIGEFVCNNVEDFSEWEYDYPSLLRHIDLYAGTKGDYRFLDNYLKGNKKGYALHITDLNIYDKPKELGEFRKPCGNCIGKCAGEHYDRCPWQTITRPPQSWQYVGEIEEWIERNYWNY